MVINDDIFTGTISALTPLSTQNKMRFVFVIIQLHLKFKTLIL